MSETSKKFNSAEIQKRFGPQVVEFLNTIHVVPDNFGSYVLPKNFIHNKWNPKSFPVIEKPEVSKFQLYLPKTPDSDEEDNFRLFTDFRRSKDLLTKKPVPDQEPAPSTSEKKVSIAQFSLEVATEKDITEIIKQNLNEKKTPEHRTATYHLKGDRVFGEIIDSKSPEYLKCVVPLSLIAGIFKKRHGQFRYNIFLDSIPQDESLFEGQLSQKQIHYFFCKIFYCVVPDQLFGNRRNNIKIKTTIRRYFKSGSEDFTLEPLLQSMNIDSIKWLDKVSHKSNKIYLLSQVLNWFFDKFIWHIIYSYLYRERTQPANYEKLLFRRWVKKRTINEYILNQVRQNIYEPIPSNRVEKKDEAVIPRLRFYVKKSGLRPVLLSKNNDKQEKLYRISQNILKRLYLSTNPPKKSHVTQRIWDTICEYHKVNGDKPLYFVCCDVKDAYGSILQNKLLEIVMKLVYGKIPRKLKRQWIEVLKPTKDMTKEPVRLQCLCLDLEDFPPLLPSGSLYCHINQPKKRTKFVRRERLKQIIKDDILNKMIRVGKKYFILKRGIGQGLPLSAVLSEIYYNDMESRELDQFVKSGHLFRYVDDFVYLTGDRKAAEEFWKITKTGLYKYNCTFKAEKTQSNVQSYDQEEFHFLGFWYNVRRMEARPNYTGIPVRYNLRLNRKAGYKPHDLFIRRIAKFDGWLKLDKFVLDPCINSKQTLTNTLKIAARMSAEKCFFLLVNLFDFKNLDRKTSYQIFFDIKKQSVVPLLKTCYRSLKVEGRRVDIKFTELESIIWFEYLQAFKKNSEISRRFGKLIKTQFNSQI